MRVSNFWHQWEGKFRKAGWGMAGSCVDPGMLPNKFASQHFCAGEKSAGGGASRGDVVPAVLEWIDVPSVEQPIPLEKLSPRLVQLLENWETHTLLDKHSLPPGRKHAFEDPLFRSKHGTLGLAQLLYRANMLRVVDKQRGPAIKCFTVLKKTLPDGTQSLRLVFDLRATNMYFCSPPFCNLANAANFAYVDLSEDIVTKEMQLVAWQGDIPNFFYELEIPAGLSQFFCLSGVSASELFASLNIKMPPEAVGNRLAVRVVSMGFSWAPWLAQTAAEDMISSVPQLMTAQEYIDDDIDDGIDDDDESDIGLDEEPRRAQRRYKF